MMATARRPTCVHCVSMRAVVRLGRCYARPFVLSSCAPHAPVVAMAGAELYALVSHFLRGAAESSPGDGAVRVRIVSGVHPEVQILAATGTKRSTRVRTLAVPRQAERSLVAGFAECSDAGERGPAARVA